MEVDVDSMKKFVTIGDFAKYIEKAGKRFAFFASALVFKF